MSAGLDTRYGTPEDREVCVADCLRAALACCKTGLDDLYTPSFLWVRFLYLSSLLRANLTSSQYLTNSGVVMLAYSASLALRLFSSYSGADAAASHTALLGLVASLALTLDRMGSTPPHRAGLASLYGRQLQRVIRNRAFALRKVHQTESSSIMLPVDLENLDMSSMSGFVDGNWDWLLGDGGGVGFVPPQNGFEWGHDGNLSFLG